MVQWPRLVFFLEASAFSSRQRPILAALRRPTPKALESRRNRRRARAITHRIGRHAEIRGYAAMTANRIALEEHFWTPELHALRRGHDVLSDPELGRRLTDLGELRIAEMDQAGIDMQVISHVEPATQNFEPAEAIRLAAAANDTLHQAIRAHPTRF